MSSRRQILITPGDRFGRLTVIEAGAKEGRNPRWRCLCECGQTTSTTPSNLANGRTQSCGCMQKEMRASIGLRATTHGSSDDLTWRRWRSMKARCELPNTKSFPRYGGRGITVCERWQDYTNFLSDMGPCPHAGMTLDRIDTNGNYSPENCRWADRTTQNRNTSRNHLLTHDGKTICVAEWAETLGINVRTILSRLAKGEAPALALRPVQRAQQRGEK